MVNLVKTLLYFNPHSHEGSDRIKWKYCGWTQISIHTPTKGATVSNGSIVDGLKFQSTLPRRERPVLSIYLLVYLLHFNPHSHEGSDEYNTLRQTTNRRYFNPHSHEGSDQDKRNRLFK